MKRLGWIVILVLLALAACDTTTREALRMVKRAEQLVDTLPDSTVRLIDSVLRMPASLSERQRMDMALLQAEALFADHGQDVSPVMDDDFFDDHDDISPSPELERAATYYAAKSNTPKPPMPRFIVASCSNITTKRKQPCNRLRRQNNMVGWLATVLLWRKHSIRWDACCLSMA